MNQKGKFFLAFGMSRLRKNEKVVNLGVFALGLAIMSVILIAPLAPQVSALNINGLWKLNANGEKADLKIRVEPPDSGLITGTAHWIGRGGGGSDPFTTKVIGFWDTATGKIVFLSENKVVFDNKSRETVVCNTVEKPDSSVVTELRDPSKDIMKTLDNLETCHGRDVAFTGYLFGDNNPNNGITPDKPWMMAGVEQVFAGGSAGVGGSPVRNTFGWCATFEVDMCGPVFTSMSNTTATTAMNATSMSNTTETAK